MAGLGRLNGWPPQRPGLAVRVVVWAVLVAVAAVGFDRQALAWSARKEVPPPGHHAKPHKPKPGPLPAPPPSLDPHATPQPSQWSAELLGRPDPLDIRVDAALRPGAKPDLKLVLRLLQEAVSARETALAARLAEPILADAHPALAVLVDAAQAVGSESGLARRMWQRAYDAGAKHPQLGRVIAEGLTDALLAAADPDAALKIVQAALLRTPAGLRRGLYERWAAIARLQGDVGRVALDLQDRADAEALVVAAQLQAEAGDDEVALGTLQTAWRRFPGHRALQAALLQLLVRLGHRAALRGVIDQVVRLAPADPSPYLVLLDALVAARDTIACRALIDELVKRYPRNDVLLEALVDREQRIGQEGARIRALYEQLLAVAPHEAQYIEAFAEWLLGRGRDKEAYEVLAKLGTDTHKLQGLYKQAELLIGHRLIKPATLVVARLAQLAPTDPKVIRLQAQLAEMQDLFALAERHWAVLAVLPEPPTPAARKQAADARHALVALLRRAHELTNRALMLRTTLLAGSPSRATALLYLDIAAQVEEESAAETAAWVGLAQQLLAQFGDDPEILAALAAGYVQRELAEAALQVAAKLQHFDPDVAEPLLQQLLEGALARRQPGLAARAEALLAVPNHGTVSQGVLLRLGDVHLRYGDAAGAAQLYRQAAVGRSDNRAAVRLAALFRQIGQPAAEEAALREVVQRGQDPDELDVAGQRLVTVAMIRDKAADLVRWFDAITPQHPRRDAMARLRSAAYDAWLRSGALLDRSTGTAPAPGPLGEALSSSDLGQQIRALRQMAAAKRLLPAAAARQLGQSGNPAVRRDVALALGAAGSVGGATAEAAAELLRDLMIDGVDNDEDVKTAQLLALANLPPVPGLDPVLDRSGAGPWHALNLLLVGIHGTPALASMLVRGREAVSPHGLLAMGAMLGRGEAGPELAELRAALLDAVQRMGTGSPDLPRGAATLWALRASNHAQAAAQLVRVAIQTENGALRRMALNLLGTVQAPKLTLELPPVGRAEVLHELRANAVRAILAPWLQADAALVRRAAQLHQGLFAAQWQAEGRAGQARQAAWCADLAVDDAPTLGLLGCR